MADQYSLRAKCIGEYLGSAFLVMAAIAPIILFHNILGADIYIAVIADALAVGFILFALIETFGPISGAHFNPAVTLAFFLHAGTRGKEVGAYMLSQIAGGLTGVLTAHLMFYQDIPKLAVISDISRMGGTYLAEILGTFFLVFAILILVRNKSDKLSYVIGMLVAGMIMATASTMFANPQVTFARIFTYSAAGIRPLDAAIFIAMEIIGALLAVALYSSLHFRIDAPRTKRTIQSIMRKEYLPKTRVLFLCTHNSCRSQISEGWLRHTKGDKYEVYSAGTERSRVHPLAIQVMKEKDVDISDHTSKDVSQFVGEKFDLVVTVCDNAREACPFFPGAIEYMHKTFKDPSNVKGTRRERLAAFRRTRDEIRDWVEEVF